MDGENPKGMHAQRAPGFDISGHGTNVARIACGNRGVASKSDILVVKMGNTDRTSFSGTTQLIKGVDFCIKKAADLGKPVAINISYGNNYGDHRKALLIQLLHHGNVQYVSEAAMRGLEQDIHQAGFDRERNNTSR